MHKAQELMGYLFVSGAPRSGTTLLELVLSSHSHITITPETNSFERIFKDSVYFDKKLKEKEFCEIFSLLQSDLKLNSWPDFELKKFFSEVRENLRDSYTLETFFQQLFASYADLKIGGKHYLGNKKGFYASECAYIVNSIFPNTKFLYIVRDPRDAVRSMIKNISGHTFFSALNIYVERIKNICEINSTLDEKSLIITYEKLVRNPRAVLSEICGYLNIPFEEGMLDFHKDNREKNLLLRNTKHIHRNTLLPFNRQLINQWHKSNYFGNFKLFMLESACGNYMERFGYTRTLPSFFTIGVVARLSLAGWACCNLIKNRYVYRALQKICAVRTFFLLEIIKLNMRKVFQSLRFLCKGKLSIPIFRSHSSNMSFIIFARKGRCKIFEIDSSAAAYEKAYQCLENDIFPSLVFVKDRYVCAEWIYGDMLSLQPFPVQVEVTARLLGLLHTRNCNFKETEFIHFERLKKRFHDNMNVKLSKKQKIMLCEFADSLQEDFAGIEGNLKASCVHPDLIPSNIIRSEEKYFVVDNEFFFIGKGKEFDIINSFKYFPREYQMLFLEEYSRYVDLGTFQTYRDFWERLYLFKLLTKHMRFKNSKRVNELYKRIEETR